MIAKVEELKVSDKTVNDDPALDKQKNASLQNGHEEEITVAS